MKDSGIVECGFSRKKRRKEPRKGRLHEIHDGEKEREGKHSTSLPSSLLSIVDQLTTSPLSLFFSLVDQLCGLFSLLQRKKFTRFAQRCAIFPSFSLYCTMIFETKGSLGVSPKLKSTRKLSKVYLKKIEQNE